MTEAEGNPRNQVIQPNVTQRIHGCRVQAANPQCAKIGIGLDGQSVLCPSAEIRAVGVEALSIAGNAYGNARHDGTSFEKSKQMPASNRGATNHQTEQKHGECFAHALTDRRKS